MPADTLLKMAQRVAGHNIDRISGGIGDMPYTLARPFLLKLQVPEQLHRIEQHSPQIVGLDAEIWLKFIKRDVPDWASKPHQPSDPKNWYRVYKKLRREADRDMSKGQDKLEFALAKVQEQKANKTAEIVERKSVPGPTTRQRISYNYHSGRNGSKGAGRMTLMEKIRKEARDVKSSKMSRPMHELRQKATTVTKAPVSFVEDLRRRPSVPPVPVSRPSQTSTTYSEPRRLGVPNATNMLNDREPRLRALKSGNSWSGQAAGGTKKRKADDGDDDDLFSESGLDPNRTGLSTGFLEDFDDDSDESPETGPSRKSNPPVQPVILTERLVKKKKRPLPSMFMTKKVSAP